MNLKKTIEELIEEISSSAPTPGGGSVSSFCGVLGTSLAMMVCNLTIGKKKYQEYESEILEIKQKLESTREKFLELYDLDSNAFDKVMDAFKLPKETEEDKIKRTEAIEIATIEASEVPIQVISTVNEVIDKVVRLNEIGNQNSLSDTGVALYLLKSCAEGAMLNVMINTKSLNDKDRARNIVLTAGEKLLQIDSKINTTLELIKKKMEL